MHCLKVTCFEELSSPDASPSFTDCSTYNWVGGAACLLVWGDRKGELRVKEG